MPDLLNNPGRTSVIITRAIERVGKIGLLGLDDTRPTAQKEGIDRLADTFSRFASTHQTAFDSGMARASSSVDGSLIERQIDRAMSQVLGRAPGRNTESFFGALADAFPVDKKGTVAFKPARTAMIFNSYDGSNGSNGLAAAGLQGQISTEQAALHRQASIVAGDALQILKCLQPFNPKADADEVEALRALVEVEIKSLVDEFGRVFGSKSDRGNATASTRCSSRCWVPTTTSHRPSVKPTLATWQCSGSPRCSTEARMLLPSLTRAKWRISSCCASTASG